MAVLRCIKAPASAPGHRWDTPTHAVKVDDGLATELLRIPDGGFVEVLPGAEGHPDMVTEPDPESSDDSTYRRRVRTRVTE